MTKVTRPHLEWDSEVSLQQVFEPGSTKHYPHRFGDYLLFLCSVPEASSTKLRTVLCLESLVDDTISLSPDAFDLHSDIHEYGGKPFWVFGHTILFINRHDKCLYRCSVQDGRLTPPQRVSPHFGGYDDTCTVSISDVNLIQPNMAIAVAELHSPDGLEPQAMIVTIDLDQPDVPLKVLTKGADFYASLVSCSIDSDTALLAWFEWQHPNMPWDNNQLQIANLQLVNREWRIEQIRSVPNDNSASFCQLMFDRHASLFCACDFMQSELGDSNFWNAYQVDTDKLTLQAISASEYEFGYPHWQFGDARLVGFDGRFLVGIAAEPSADFLWVFDQKTQQQTFIKSSGTLQHLNINRHGEGAVVEMPIDGIARVVVFSILDDGRLDMSLSDGDARLFNSFDFDRTCLPIAVSVAEHIEYPTRDGGSAYAFYYPPANAQYQCEDAPPAIVMVHGGPTARAYGYFDLQKQFWTSSGFAVIDVNHRGSSGYGRHYRDALYGEWGELDCSDIVDAIEYLSLRQLIDPRGVCIRGKSAGGYAVLRALTEHAERFAAGASYYGIGDLATLAESTHKFEKHYTDRLIGEPYTQATAEQANSRYQLRSPINYIKNLKNPMAIFQGSLDKVVPVALAHDLVAALKAGGIEYQYHEYPDEAHGFKSPQNNIAAWTAELAFYRKTLKPLMLN